MDLERLKSLGFCLIAGQVDYQGKNYGSFNAHGALLTDEGDELVAQLEDEAARSGAAPKATRGRKPKPTAPAEGETGSSDDGDDAQGALTLE